MSTLCVDDFVVLGRTVPEESRKYGQRVCMAGYSESINQFLRVYPLLVPVGSAKDANGFRARHRYALDLGRNANDTRMESWRVADEIAPSSTPWTAAPEVRKPRVLAWLKGRLVPSIKALNDCRLSLGVLHIPGNKWEGFSVPRDAKKPPEHHQTLFDDLAVQAAVTGEANLIARVKHAPYIRFTDDDGPHNLQVREWGAYMLLGQEKYADLPDSLWSAAGYRSGKGLYLVVGNMNNHRKNWLIIKTFEVDAAPATGDLPFGDPDQDA